ncbi:MAG TPA: anti-sigma factor [Alphaproteobacteria bacterium]|nr:anti-sigma factor [Alphaproteobacteria bacterium]
MKDHAQFAEALSLYAMGALDNQQERAELEAHLGSCGECRRELESLRGDLALLALSTTGPAPPPRSRQRLMDAIAREPHMPKRSPQIAVGVLRPRWLTFAPVAAAIVLAVVGLLLLQDVIRLKRQVTRAQNQLQTEREQSQRAQAIMEILTAPKAQRWTLVATQTPPQPHVRTIYMREKAHVLLIASNLGPLPQKKVYQLWLLPADGSAPMPAGTFMPDANGSALMDHVMSAGIDAKAFAITMEPEGGSQTPTMPIVLAPAG